jgi:Fe2+-dicitrate sensor, membrane component
MNNTDIKHILEQYLQGTCSEEERKIIDAWYQQWEAKAPDLSAEEIEEDLQAVFASLPRPAPRRRLRPILLRIAAAAVIIGVAVGAFFYLTPSSAPQPTAQTPVSTEKNDLAPGENKAVLTLADGSTILLDNETGGEIANQNGIKVIKTGDGALVYVSQPTNAPTKALPSYNTITTPRGGQYQVTLPDGTVVWLNAASSLKYPTAFTGKERIVELTGEGYFEVASNKDMPFKVQAADQTVEVLGTHFNINCYADEPAVKTTLLEGSVKVMHHGTHKSMTLKPGEQSTVSRNNFSVAMADTENAVAWKNNLFYFSGSDIPSVMRQISRWYNVTVEFEGAIPDIRLWGKVYRNSNASKVLELLEYFGLKYHIEENNGSKKIIIQK